MPTTKLTLSADQDLVRQAKQLARQRGTSLSAMFDRFIRSVVSAEESAEPLGPITAQALGLVQLPADVDDATLLAEALTEKYGD